MIFIPRHGDEITFHDNFIQSWMSTLRVIPAGTVIKISEVRFSKSRYHITFKLLPCPLIDDYLKEEIDKEIEEVCIRINAFETELGFLDKYNCDRITMWCPDISKITDIDNIPTIESKRRKGHVYFHKGLSATLSSSARWGHVRKMLNVSNRGYMVETSERSDLTNIIKNNRKYLSEISSGKLDKFYTGRIKRAVHITEISNIEEVRITLVRDGKVIHTDLSDKDEGLKIRRISTGELCQTSK